VTVCLASICESLHKIVMVSDAMVTCGGISVDGTMQKSAPIHRNWYAVFAADDVTDVRAIMDFAMLRLCSSKDEKFLVEVAEHLSMAYAKRHDDLATFNVLRPAGFNGIDDFYERGKQCLTTSEFKRLSRELRAAVPKCIFLVGGFDCLGIAHLLLQQANSAAECMDDPGFWAIGSGQEEALNALFFQADKLGFSIGSSEAECTYHLLAAKFMAESNSYVGRETFVTVHAYNEPVRYLLETDIERIRAAWWKSAVPKLPISTIRQIPKMLVTMREAEEREQKLIQKLRGLSPRS
jgi:hypothetical protein